MVDERDRTDLSMKIIEARLEGINECIAARIDGMDRAAVLKAEEIDRRLEEHNKLREEVVTDRRQFLRAETFESFEKARSEWKTLVDNQLTKLMTKYDSRMTTANITAIIALLLTVVNIVIFVITL